MSFTNLYYKRAVATARPCFICYKPTTTVLATAQTVDFIYVCDGHLSDPGFASLVGETNDGVGAGGAKMGLTPDEIAAVKQEWEARQKKRQEKKEKEKEKADDAKEKEDKIDQDGGSKAASSKVPSPPPSGSATPTTATKPSHQRYTLHRDMFALRLAEHRKRRQAAQAKELAPRLPGAPKVSLPPSS
ncbi:uncharacterized protein FIBRA_05501 [Fibroporia radiculosa]|uniref:DUF1742-domain-containing protein n=1 Tax=Fibroporia radiculosa TaxID=599839 RepID=J4IAR5_9APHY|nr:uncharacterized protein FIBRA_05501 [Fibroporia radiculosa]CCM03371.1 predicted protein [Fibroporia radiculosa]